MGSRELLDWERRYVDLFRAHGAYASTDLDLTDWQERAPFLDGIHYWPVFVDGSSKEALQRDVRGWIAALAGRGVEPFAIPIDEPLRPARQLEVRLLAGWAREAGSGPGRLLYAVTDVPRLVYGDRIDVYINPYAVVGRNRDRAASPSGQADKVPDIWTYNGGAPFAGSMIIDTDGTALRTWGWIGYRYDLPLWYAWEGMYFTDRYNDKVTTDVERDPVTFADKEDHGNGDGLLAYPGALPSLRLKALRRGLEDRALLRLLASCGGAAQADALAEELVPAALGERKKGQPATWPVDEAAWEAARMRLIDAALAACPATGP
jgi:hypothetical protein